MPISTWISAHTFGWPIFTGAAVALAVAGAAAHARGRRGTIPWFFLAALLAGVGAFYLKVNLDRYRAPTPRLWGAQLGTLAVVVAVPLVLVLGTLALWSRRRAPSWPAGATLAATVGILAMGLAPHISALMFRLLHGWMMATGQ